MSELGAMGVGICWRTVYRRRQNTREDGKGQIENGRITMTDRDTDRELDIEIAGEDAERCTDGWQEWVYGRAIWLGVAEQGKEVGR